MQTAIKKKQPTQKNLPSAGFFLVVIKPAVTFNI